MSIIFVFFIEYTQFMGHYVAIFKVILKIIPSLIAIRRGYIE